jgi:glutamate formiminotransferase/formiminotetrahydrofolate cyclodeaminase
MSLPPLVECVPNFSEGRDPEVIRAITDAIAAVEGVSLLDVDPGEATNRTVVTFVAPPEAALEGAFAGIKRASELIDMSRHAGAHPRIGATDVCPFVPVRGATMEDCAALARRLAERVGGELGIPVYLYEHAASRPERRNLATVRSGEYEGLAAKLADPEWAPDAGPAELTERARRSGATVIGARPFLIAYNVNLNTRSVRKAMKIAALVREKGILQRDDNDEIVRDAEGKGVRAPGLFKDVKAIGWFIEEYDRCQVSINFTDYRVSPVHEVVDAIRRVADQEGVVATGSELVGLIPMEAMRAAGRHYLRRQGVNPGAPDDVLIETAIRSLGLRELGPFDPNEAIIERRIGGDGPLVRLTGRGFVDKLASDAPAPGGGSVAALCGAMAAGLAAMVAQLTTGKKGYEGERDAMDAMAIEAQQLKEAFLADVDADTAAFDAFLAARALPKETDEEQQARRLALRAATVATIEVPLGVLERTVETLKLVEIAARGNKNARSDAGVGALVAMACAEGAWYNVCINLKGFKGPRGPGFRQRADAALEAAGAIAERVRAAVRAELGGA